MIVIATLCFIFLGNLAADPTPSTKAIETNNQTITNRYSGENFVRRPDRKLVSAKELLQELGSNKKQIIEESIYNETKDVKICWKNILYANETVDGFELWEEYQVVFHFPGEDDQIKDERPKQYKKYGIQREANHTIYYDLEVLETHHNYTLSKQENVTCGNGNFLSKAYYEWPKTDKKKVVLRLTKDHPVLKYGRDEFVDLSTDEEGENDILGSPIDDGSDLSISTTEESNKGVAEQWASSDENPPTPRGDIVLESDQHKLPVNVTTKSANTSRNFEKDNASNVSRSSKGEDTAPHPGQIDKLTEKHAVNLTNLCSPLLSQLLSGNGLLPGLCTLTKDEKVILQGDILVSKKYFDELNKTDVVKPMFVIHENTEIVSINTEKEED